jgi:hypothetical protein
MIEDAGWQGRSTLNSRAIWRLYVLVLLAVSLAGCVALDRPLTVSQVWENADALEGQRIRVRGEADFRLAPYHPLQIGGCVVDAEGETKSRITGELRILDQDSLDPDRALLISESSLQCEGDVCSVVCKPFAPSRHAAWGATDPIEAFEFVGILRVLRQADAVTLILDELDLAASRRLADGEWGPVPTGEFTYLFP